MCLAQVISFWGGFLLLAPRTCSEVCISEIADPSLQSSLESELQLRQQQHANCRGEPMTAAIRTERDGTYTWSGRPEGQLSWTGLACTV